ncbi:TetR/AcrR family transcriptional regulator C-terminal ligand-binding domain-containing protein [Streptomyces sp. NPDC046385]|uniref:TetR/AcrR family transcriptional regulator n=1 Tax=Streptomyces sp. NPDC046385 TaxID=3154918 RepID=UPI0033E3A63A
MAQENGGARATGPGTGRGAGSAGGTPRATPRAPATPRAQGAGSAGDTPRATVQAPAPATPRAEGAGSAGGTPRATAPPPPPTDDCPASARRGRPRSEAAEQAIFDAAIGLLEGGTPLTELSIERIARTAGVGKATIYRRWPGKEELFVDLLRSVELPDPVLPGVSVRDDLVALMESIRRRGLAKRNSALLHNVFSQMQSYPKLWDAYHQTVIDPRRRLGLDVVRRGMELGEIRDDLDVELVNDLFTGPLLLRTVIRPGATLEPDLAEQVVDAVLEGVRPRD